MDRKVVVTLHGIRTVGKWQKDITPYLARYGLIPYHLDYGRFSLPRFVFAPTRRRRVQWLRNELRELKEKARCTRLSVIAHSFGTYLIATALEQECGNLQLDRVVLTGCIVRGDYDWAGMIEKRWVHAVRNERATHDRAVSMAGAMSRLKLIDAGATGRDPFARAHPKLIDRCLVGGHSEVHNPDKFDQWARFIAYPQVLPPNHLGRVASQLQMIRQTAAGMLQLDPSLLRTNLFAPSGSTLRMVPGVNDNMLHAPEFDVEIERGHGCTGTAFDIRDVCTVWRQKHGWSRGHLPSAQMGKVNPRLAWVISIPILSRVRSDAKGAEVLAVANIDGLDTIPPLLQHPDSPQVKEIVVALAGVVAVLQSCLDAAHDGDDAQT